MGDLNRRGEPGLPRRALLREGAAALVGFGLRRRAHAAAASVRELRFYQTHTGEHTRVAYFENGAYQSEALAAIDRALCDHRNGEVHPIDRRLLDLLYALAARLETREPFHVISAYRSAATNAMLARQSRGVSPRSLHLRGEAIDVRVPDRSLDELRRAARSLRAGGVGSYPGPNFVHVDVGRVRFW
jgi:uncharacterized protein YcbK (DUF882 family)